MNLEALIAQRFASPEWAVFYEVASAGGFESKRYADAIAMSIWHSRGYQIHGFEVKRSHGDFRRELAQPDKSDPIAKFCHYWWIVAPDTKVAPVDQLPEAWGLLVESKGKLRIAKQAPRKEPEPVTAEFVACCLRRISEATMPKAVHDDVVRMAVEEAVKGEEARLARTAGKEEIYSYKQKFEDLQAMVEAFNRRTGINLSTWGADALDGKRFGSAFNLARDLVGGNYDDLTRAVKAAKDFVGNVSRIRKGLDIDAGEESAA